VTTLDEDQAWALLRALDDPEYLEVPRGYDHRATRERFDELAARLDETFGCRCGVDREIQDASRHGSIVVPAAALGGTAQVTVVVSNFGDLAVSTVGNPAERPSGAAPAFVAPEHLWRIAAALDDLGYVTVPEHVLWTPYDGVSPLGARYTADDGPSWWIRFFDYP
jgi:hypothetical protein